MGNGPNETGEVRSSGLQLPSSEGQQVLRSLLPCFGGTPIIRLQLWTPGVCWRELSGVALRLPTRPASHSRSITPESGNRRGTTHRSCTLKTICRCEVPLFPIQPRRWFWSSRTGSQLTIRHCAWHPAVVVNRGKEICHGRKETREVRPSGVRVRCSEGQQILQSVLREHVQSTTRHLQLRACGVCCWGNGRCGRVVLSAKHAISPGMPTTCTEGVILIATPPKLTHRQYCTASLLPISPKLLIGGSFMASNQ
jgi:hypothetical protein